MAILMPTRDRPAILKRSLEELLKLGFGGHQLIVYDDASEDPRAVKEVVSIWPNARLLRAETRIGQAKGRNQLMRACPCEYALFLDDDCFPEQLGSVLGALQTVVSDRLGIATFTYKALADGSLSVSPEQKRGVVSCFLGGASLFHIPSVLAVGGYREYLIYGYEEPELALRLWIAGTRVEYLPGVVIIHNQFYTPDEKRDYQEYDYLYARNGILWSSLNLPLLLGLPHGLIRSIRRSLVMKRNLWPKLCGTLRGISMTFEAWRERRPCSWRQALHWIRFARQKVG